MSHNVQDIVTIIRKELAEQAQRRTIVLTMLGMAAIWSVQLALLGRSLRQRGVPSAVFFVLDLIFTHHALPISMIVYVIPVSQIYLKEKYTRTLETLLTTRITPIQVWISKVLFGTALGVACAYLTCFSGWVVLNVVANSTGSLIWPSGPAVFFLLIVVPVTAFLVGAIVGLVNLLSWNPTLCNFLLMLVGVGYLGASSASSRMAITWPLAVTWLVIAVLLLLAVLLGSRRLLTRERIILGGH